ncbi:MAG: hypothetical protein CMM77_11795 [Rhodospirillaceae bacterium]|nr:hypothetical protein [Magnetovibrio sp.]MAY67800.1 hypothetical protein [Rhodospirillaceae bacterium]
MVRSAQKRGNDMSDVALSAAVRSSLLALQRTTDLIDRTNNRLSTGLRVANPVDDPVAFFSSKALRDRAFDFTERKSGIDQGISTVTAALDGVESIDSLVRQLKGIATSLKSSTGTQFVDLVNQFNEIRSQIGELANDSEFQGINLIDNTTESLVVNFSNTTTSKLTINATNLRESGLSINPLEIRADSKIGVSATVGLASGISLISGTNISTISATAATAFTAIANKDALTVTYNGTGVVVDSSGPITLSLTSSVTITIRAITGQSFTVTRGQALSLSLTTVVSFASGGAFNASGISGVTTGLILGVVGGAQIFNNGTGVADVRAINTAGTFQSVSFVGENLPDDIDNITVNMDAALQTLRSEAQKLGSNVALLQTRLDFTEQYTNTLEGGADKLTLADLNQEGANLLALQTRQQLGISALAFAGQSEQGILQLFN